MLTCPLCGKEFRSESRFVSHLHKKHDFPLEYSYRVLSLLQSGRAMPLISVNKLGKVLEETFRRAYSNDLLFRFETRNNIKLWLQYGGYIVKYSIWYRFPASKVVESFIAGALLWEVFDEFGLYDNYRILIPAKEAVASALREYLERARFIVFVFDLKKLSERGHVYPALYGSWTRWVKRAPRYVHYECISLIGETELFLLHDVFLDDIKVAYVSHPELADILKERGIYVKSTSELAELIDLEFAWRWTIIETGVRLYSAACYSLERWPELHRLVCLLVMKVEKDYTQCCIRYLERLGTPLVSVKEVLHYPKALTETLDEMSSKKALLRDFLVSPHIIHFG